MLIEFRLIFFFFVCLLGSTPGFWGTEKNSPIVPGLRAIVTFFSFGGRAHSPLPSLAVPKCALSAHTLRSKHNPRRKSCYRREMAAAVHIRIKPQFVDPSLIFQLWKIIMRTIIIMIRVIIIMLLFEQSVTVYFLRINSKFPRHFSFTLQRNLSFRWNLLGDLFIRPSLEKPIDWSAISVDILFYPPPAVLIFRRNEGTAIRNAFNRKECFHFGENHFKFLSFSICFYLLGGGGVGEGQKTFFCILIVFYP